VLQHQLDQLVARRLVAARRGRMYRGRLNSLVARQRIDVRAALDQQASSVDIPEEAREPERMKAVVAERVRARRILVQHLAQPVGASECCRLEDARLALGREALRVGTVSAVERLEDVRHR
jgi:hypothetical protein